MTSLQGRGYSGQKMVSIGVGIRWKRTWGWLYNITIYRKLFPLQLVSPDLEPLKKNLTLCQKIYYCHPLDLAFCWFHQKSVLFVSSLAPSFQKFLSRLVSTVIHWLMIHHHPMIHFCNINNFLKTAYIFMKQFFLDTYIYSPPTVQIWQGLNKLQVWHISIKSGCFADFAQKGSLS